MSTLPPVLPGDVRVVLDPNAIRRPRRDVTSSLNNPAIRLASEEDISLIRALKSRAGTVTVDSTPMVESWFDPAILIPVDNAGLLLGEEERSKNAVVVGAIGAGKTYTVGAGMYEGTLRDTTESIVRMNLKGPKGTEEDIGVANAIRPHCPVFVFAPGDSSRGIQFNPLEYARRHGMIGTLLKAIVGSQARGSQETAFWEFTAEKNLRILLEEPSITSLAEIEEILSDPATLAKFAKDNDCPQLAEFARFVKESANGMTCFADMASRLNQFCSIKDLRDRMRWETDVDFVAMFRERRPFVLIIECNESTFFQARFVVNLFIAMILESAMRVAEERNGRLPVPINFFLDEFGVIPPLAGFAAKANLYRSRGVRFVVFVQSIQQIRSAYEAEAESLLAAFNTKVFLLSGLSLSDREYASRLGGNIVVQDWRETQQINAEGAWATVSRTSQSAQRPLLTPDDLQQIGTESEYGRLAAVFIVDRPPMLVYFTPAWKLPVFSLFLDTPSTKSKKRRRRRSKRRRGQSTSTSAVQYDADGWTIPSKPKDEVEIDPAQVESQAAPLTNAGLKALFSKQLAEADREPREPTTSSDGW